MVVALRSPSSTAQSPTISYGSAGTYSVTLTVIDSTGKTATKTNTITVLAPVVTSPPVAGFTASAKKLSAKFTDTSTGSISSWSWNFGEPSSLTNTSTAQNPSHIYSVAGTYPVTLTVTGPGGSSIQKRSISVSNSGRSGILSAPINADTISAPINADTTGGVTEATLSGLVAAYGFDETTGTIAADASGFGNHGNIQQAVRIAKGRFGKALKFDGVNEGVVVDNGNNSQSLALSTGMTLEAWVYPTATMDGGRTIITKVQSESDYTEAYRLVANDTTNLPMSTIWAENPVSVAGNKKIPSKQWTHLATTYDGQYQTLYINGVLVDTRPQTGAIPTSNGALQIGYNAAWGYTFQGYIDEVRIYNRALNNAEIINDAKTAISASNPPQFVVGDQNVEPTAEYSQAGVIRAFQVRPQETKMVTNIQVYLDAGSTAKNLKAGIYSANTDGRPLQLLTNGYIDCLKSRSLELDTHYATVSYGRQDLLDSDTRRFRFAKSAWPTGHRHGFDGNGLFEDQACRPLGQVAHRLTSWCRYMGPVIDTLRAPSLDGWRPTFPKNDLTNFIS